jgi:amino acid exporter
MNQIEYYYSGILLVYIAFVMAMFSPGPNILSVIGTSMNRGRDAGKALALGIGAGSFLWGMLTVSGLSALLTMYASVMVVLKVLGAAYLLWLAFKAFRSASRPQNIQISAVDIDGGFWSYFKAGLVIQMSNPKAAFTWIAIASLAVDPSAPLWVSVFVVLGTTIISISGHFVYAVAFSTMPVVMAYNRFRRWFESALGLFFTFASYRLLMSDSK